MNAMQEQSRSVWMSVVVAPAATPLQEDSKADVAIVGAGIAGLSIAYELLRKNLSVVVLDRGPIAGGMTSRTTAHLAPICDDSLSELVSMRGEDQGRGFQASQAAAVDRIEAIVAEHGIDCEFRRLDGVLFLDPSSDESVLDDEVGAAAKLDVEVSRKTGLPFLTLETAPHLRYPRQATFHPLKYLKALADILMKGGVRLHPHTAVMEITETDTHAVVKLDNGRRVMAQQVVVATNSPIHDRFAFHTKQAPYRTYAMGFEIERDLLPDALYWDTADPYHYIRLTSGENGKDVLIVGGEDHKTGEANDADQRFEALEEWIRNLVPQLGPELHRWSGQVMDTLDYAAYIGRDGTGRIFVVTGDSGQGITHGVVASLIIPPLMAGEESEYASVYEPSRRPIRAAGTFISENMTAVTNMAEYARDGEIAVEDLAPGQGGIIRQGLNKIAAYRDEHGKLHRHSAVCTHLGCHLEWNAFEGCWDCPCHGSHFAPDGSVLNGPAIRPLPATEDD